MSNKGSLIIISGPSGSGKDTVLKEVFKKMPELKFSISSITREMRAGEVQGEKYNFISRESFEEMINNDMLLEYNVYCNNYYGTPAKPVNEAIQNGDDIILEVDVNGAANVRKKCPDNFSIFIAPPSFKVLESRLKKRGTDSEEVIAERMSEAVNETKRANEYDYIVVNDDLDTVVDDVCDIIRAERHKSARCEKLINNLLF